MRVEEAPNSGGGDGGASAVGQKTIDVERTRIYVGGLGETVTEDDLRKTFSALGKIEAVDIVRTKGRSLAYLDFIPSSEKSLSKLFSTYNGCMWKGGRLRLEKAKEHYLLRLKREWQEEVDRASDASASNANASENMVSLEKPKRPTSLDKMPLKIFFPKLRKVKSVPWSGTGKHKYSFQRIQVPSFPIHFCDCPEHYIPPHTVKGKTFSNLEATSGGINEEELNIMNSVMKRLLVREDLPSTAGKEYNLPTERENSDGSVDDLPADDSEVDHMTDEDNLIINVVAGKKDRMDLIGSESLEAKMANKEPVSDKSQTFKDRLPQNTHNTQKKMSLPHRKKQILSDAEEIGENRRTSSQLRMTTSEDVASELKLGIQQMKSNSLWKQKSGWKNLIGQKGDSPFSISYIIPNVTLQKEDEPRTSDLDVPSVVNKKEEPQSSDTVRIARGAAWLAKSSWTQLVSSTINSPFSISQVLPGLTSEKEEQPKHNITNVVNSRESEESMLKPVISNAKEDSSDASGIAKQDVVTCPLVSHVIPWAKHDHNSAGKGMELKPTEEKLTKIGVVPASSLEETHPSKSKQKALGDFEFSETCPFMRTEASMKEWRKRKGLQSNAVQKKKKG